MANNPKVINGRLVQKHGTYGDWNLAENFVPMKGELIVFQPSDEEVAEGKILNFKIGNNISAAKSDDLPFLLNRIPDEEIYAICNMSIVSGGEVQL